MRSQSPPMPTIIMEPDDLWRSAPERRRELSEQFQASGLNIRLNRYDPIPQREFVHWLIGVAVAANKQIEIEMMPWDRHRTHITIRPRLILKRKKLQMA